MFVYYYYFWYKTEIHGSIELFKYRSYSACLQSYSAWIHLVADVYLYFLDKLIALNAALRWNGTGPRGAELGTEGGLI